MASQSSEPAVRVPSDDVPGREISGLPRYPGSVRVEYERGQREGLEMVRARYLMLDSLDAVRGYYRGVFRAKGWEVANVEFYEDEWTFLVIHGEREADIEIEAQGQDVTDVDIELSEPLPEKAPAPKEKPQKPKAEPAPPQPATPATATPASSPQSASPAPQSASPAPGYYGDDRDDFDDYDDFGDDGGGDD